MCGIAGLVRFGCSSDSAHDETLVRQMCEIQGHRGPDDLGIISLDDVCLGSVRLSIIDLSEAGHMPMSDPTGRWWIAYNGEVYNFKEIRRQLIQCGHTFRSETDTEVVLHAYIEWGEDCLHRFVGMFAFAVHDRQGKKLVLVRDRYGKKPLYYTRTGHCILFSSELKALLHLCDRPAINNQSLVEWSLYKNIDILTPDTLVEGIYSLLPGQIATIQGSQISIRTYYAPTEHVESNEYQRFSRTELAKVVDEFDILLNQATRERLVSDVPVGTLCSGGLDSSLITAIAARYSNELTGFHVSISGYPALDEKPFADELTKRLGIELVAYSLTGEAFRRELPRVIYLSDLPLTHPNSVAYYLISQVARKHGVIVLLSGEGADELFGGYSWRYRRYKKLLQIQPLLDALPQKVKMGLALLGFACAGITPTGHNFRELVPHTLCFIDRYARRGWQLRCEEAYRFVNNARDAAVLGIMLADLGDFLTPLLRRLDRTSMGASTECRVPFLDHRLVHKAINLPLSYRIGRRSDKWLLKQVAARYLSTKLIYRKKAGFPLTLQDYVLPLADMALFADGFCSDTLGLDKRGIEEVIASCRRNVVGCFSLVSLEIWGRLFIRREPIETLNDMVGRIEHGHNRK